MTEKPMLPKRTLAALLVASLSAGCAVGPDYVRPEISPPADYQDQPGSKQQPEKAAAELASWWSAFGEPQPTRCVSLALAKTLVLGQTAARVAQAGAGLGAADAALL